MKSSTGSRSFLLLFLFVVVNATKNDKNDVVLSSSSSLLLRKEHEQNTSLKQINNNKRRSMLRRQLNSNEQISNSLQPLTYLEEEVTALVQEWEDETHSSFHNKSSPNNEKEHEQKDNDNKDDDEEEADNDEIIVIEETSVVEASSSGTEEKEEEESDLADVVIVEGEDDDSDDDEEQDDENDKKNEGSGIENEKNTTTTQDEYTTDNSNEDNIEGKEQEQEVIEDITNTTLTSSFVNTTTAVTTKTKDDDNDDGNEQSTIITSPVTTIIDNNNIEKIETNSTSTANNNDTMDEEEIKNNEKDDDEDDDEDEDEENDKEVVLQQEEVFVDRYKYYCPIGRESRTLHKIKPSGNKLSEVSYIAYSQQTYKGSSVIWMGSDGAQNTIHAIAMNNGKLIQTYKLHIKRRGDWESISLGPCDTKTASNVKNGSYRKECLYLHNGGNNSGARCHSRDCRSSREYHYIHKLEEPNVNNKYDGKSIKVVTLRYNYEHKSWPSNHNDCESMFVDFTGDSSTKEGHPGDIYILTKQPYDRSYQRIGKLSVFDHQDLIPLNNKKGYYDVIMKAVGKASLEIPWNGSDMTRSGTLIASRRDDIIYFYPRLPHESVVDALEQPPCSYTSETYRDGKHMNRFEAVTFISHYTDDNDESFNNDEEDEEGFSTYYNSTYYYNDATDGITSSNITNILMNDNNTTTTTTIVTKSRTSQLLSRPSPKPAANISLLEVSECGQKQSCKLPVVEYKLLF